MRDFLETLKYSVWNYSEIVQSTGHAFHQGLFNFLPPMNFFPELGKPSISSSGEQVHPVSHCMQSSDQISDLLSIYLPKMKQVTHEDLFCIWKASPWE